METDASKKFATSSLDSSFPVFLPEDPVLFLGTAEFESYVHDVLQSKATGDALAGLDIGSGGGDYRHDVFDLDHSAHSDSDPVAMEISQGPPPQNSVFMEALKKVTIIPKAGLDAVMLSTQNRMFTENRGIAHISTNSALLDLFTELGKTIPEDRLSQLLEDAWEEDALATLKIIWNARSIHLGKGENDTFYRCILWMRRRHPETVLTNLQWLYRSVIEKKVKDSEDDAVMIKRDGEAPDDEIDVQYGVSHGCWKDLLNILVLVVSNTTPKSGNDVHNTST
jgi:hypothetical protein